MWEKKYKSEKQVFYFSIEPLLLACYVSDTEKTCYLWNKESLERVKNKIQNELKLAALNLQALENKRI